MSEISNPKSRRRVLLITRNFPPQIGGMERFNLRVVEQLTEEFDLAVCGPVGAEAFLPEGTKFSAASLRSLPIFLVQAAWGTAILARSFKPDIVIAGSGLTVPIAILIARVCRIPSFVFVYGLDLVVKNWFYQHFWIPALRACDQVIAISRYTRQLAVAKGINSNRITIWPPGVDAVRFDEGLAREFRKEQQLGDRPLMICIGRLTRRKGLVEFVANCLPNIVNSCPDAMLICIGGDPVTSLTGNKNGVGEEAMTVARAKGVDSNFRLLGKVKDDVLASALQASDVHVFPILELPGDVEGFGIVALEAAASGIPTVAFAAGGVPDAVGPRGAGDLIEIGDYAGMTRAVISRLRLTSEERTRQRASCIEFSSTFEWDRLGVRLRQIVNLGTCGHGRVNKSGKANATR